MHPGYRNKMVGAGVLIGKSQPVRQGLTAAQQNSLKQSSCVGGKALFQQLADTVPSLFQTAEKPGTGLKNSDAAVRLQLPNK